MTEDAFADTYVSSVGVGLCYQKEMHDFTVEHSEIIDYLEIVPDTAWTDHGRNRLPRYVDDAETLGFFLEVRKQMPIVAHSIGLSIGSAHRFREEHVEQVARWNSLLDFPWHSDHLAFNIVADSSEQDYLLGVPFPVMLDASMLEVIAGRVKRVTERIPKPFLLENNVSYIQYADEDFGEPFFLNELCSRTGCGVLLDLHNLYVDCRNHAVDPDNFLAALTLSNVVEVHLAGGLTYQDVYLDAHSGPVPEDVWRLAEGVVPLCKNLKGVTFELLGSWFRHMGDKALVETLHRMRELASSNRREPLSGNHEPAELPISAG